MRWEHIDQNWIWRPTCGNKVKRCHAVPLPKLVQRILSPRQQCGRVLGAIKPDALMDQLRVTTDTPDFIWHGLRHVMESKLKQLRVPPHLRDEILDHKADRGSGDDYDHFDPFEEMLEAFEKWTAHLEKLVSPADGIAVLR